MVIEALERASRKETHSGQELEVVKVSLKSVESAGILVDHYNEIKWILAAPKATQQKVCYACPYFVILYLYIFVLVLKYENCNKHNRHSMRHCALQSSNI